MTKIRNKTQLNNIIRMFFLFFLSIRFLIIISKSRLSTYFLPSGFSLKNFFFLALCLSFYIIQIYSFNLFLFCFEISYHQNADLSDNSPPRKSGNMMLNNEVINKRISLSARTIVNIDTQNLIISRRANTNIDKRFPIIPIATAHGITK